MKLQINQSPEFSEPEIIINCNQISRELQHLIAKVNQNSTTLTARQEEAIYHIPADQIAYIDSVDGQTFLYSKSKNYESREKLYELEAKLTPASFVRISKNTIVNISAIRCVRPCEISRMELSLTTGEKLVVSRKYLQTFKDAFGV